MNINKVIAMYFSPNGSTKEMVNKVARDIGNYDVEEIDLTLVESRNKKIEFNKDELVVIGFPVYGDRLPSLSDEIFKNIEGNDTPTVAIVSYGNREYGDALLELVDRLKDSNMKTISAAAMVGEHCLNTNIATGRPDEKDNLKILEYANKVSDKIKDIVAIENIEAISVKGNYPYHPLKPQPTPVGDSKCIQCGLCEKECPVNAIDKNDYRNTNGDTCIFCGHCIQVCPTGARDMKQEAFVDFIKRLEVIAGERKEIEIFMG